MRIVVTGATSFIGLAVTKELLDKGHEVFAVARPDSPGRRRLEGRCAGTEWKNHRRSGGARRSRGAATESGPKRRWTKIVTTKGGGSNRGYFFFFK